MELQMGGDVEVCDNHFRLNGVGYYRTHADAVQLGDVGAKKMPVGQANHLAVHESVPRDRLTFVVLEMKTALNLARAIRFEASGAGAAWAVAGVGDDGSRTVVTFAPGSTFAYLLLEPTWSATSRRSRIEQARDDPWSSG